MSYKKIFDPSEKSFFASLFIPLILNALFSRMVLAMPANPNSFIEVQPDGTKVTLQIKGDEHFHTLQDMNGFTVVRNNGAFFYADLNAQGQLIATPFKVGQVNPGAVNLSPGILPPEDLREQSDFNPPNSAPSANPPQRAPTSGSVKNLVVMIRFANHSSRVLPTTANMNVLFNAENADPELAPTGSVKGYFLENSYSQLSLDTDFSDWIDVLQNEQYYADGVSGLGSKIWEALIEALDELDQSIDFTQYDQDGDGYIDAITFIHSGYAAEWGTTDTAGVAYTDRIWSHKWNIMPEWVSGEGVKVSNYHISPGLWGVSGSEIGRIGVIAHETAHFFGLPDLYDTNGVGEGVGSYGLMANSWGFDGQQWCPPHLSAWSKIQLQWVNPTYINADGLYTLNEAEFNAEVFKIDEGFPFGEYLLIENRQNSGFDCSMPQGGLAIWHIDEAKDTGIFNSDNTTEGFPGQLGWPENDNHYRVALLQADQFYDLEQGYNRGDSGDLYHAGGVDIIGPGPLNYPNTDTYQSGRINQTGYTIHSVSSSGSAMTFCLGEADCQNIAPTATNDSAGPIDPNASVSVDVLSNDADSDGTLVAGTVTVVTTPSHGTTSIDAVTGVITYTDDGTATTDDTFTYTVEDNLGALSNEATVTISINSSGGGNQSPVATDDSAGPIDPSASVAIDVLSNDSDSDGTLVAGTVTVVTTPSHGTTSIDVVTGAITYTDDGTATTDDTFTYTVEDNLGALSNAATVTVSINSSGGGNQSPVALNDSAGPIDPSASVAIDVLSNDSDSDGTLVAGTVAVVTAPSHGTTSIDAVTGAITYTDNGTETTDDTFTYTVEDNLGGLSNEATVTISITHANGTCGMGLSLDGSDDWVNVPNLVFSGDFTVEAWVNLAPGISGVDALVGQEGTGIDFNFFGGKVRLFEPFTDRIAANTIIQPNTWTHIALTRLGSSLSLYINGLLDATGTWSGSFPIKALGRGNQSFAGHLEGELDEVRLWTVARSGSDITANYNQSVAANSAGLTAYWSFNESGQVVEDLSGSGNNGSLGSGAGAGNDDPQRVISGAPISENCSGGGGNQSPVAVNDSAGPIDPNTSVSVDVLSNDADSDGTLAAGTVTVVTAPSHGTTSIDAVTGAITYTDDGTATTDDTFTYTVEDNLGALSNAATVTVSINSSGGGNQSPVAVNDSAGPIDPNTSVSVDVLSNDSDSDGTLVAGTVAVVTAPSHGTTSIDAVTGAITYTDNGTETTDDTFTYTVEDNLGGLSNEATVTISITHANGTCGMGLSLDGSDDWVNVPNLVFSGDFTVEAWVNLAPGISGVDALVGQEGTGIDFNFFGGKVRLFEPFTDRIAANTIIQPNTWTHIALTRLGSSLSLYINGLLDATGTWSGSFPIKALGRGNQSFAGHLEGELDEVRLWTVARSGSDITANYNQSVAANSAGLTAYWSFNESGQVVEDLSGSGNNGSLGSGAGAGNDDPQRVISGAPINENCNGGGGNQSPTATNDSAGPIDPNASVSVDVLSNDADSDGTLVAGTVTVVTTPSHGTTSIDAVTGVITYTDDGTATTDDTFTYTVEDNLGALSNEATVTISINSSGGGNQSPVATDDSAGPIDPSASVAIDVLSNDSDSDGTLVAGTVTVVTTPSHGTTSIDVVTGAITYTDDGTATTDDTFTYTVEDNLGALSNAATVTVSINSSGGGNQSPVALNDSAGPIDPSASVAIDVLSNDSDSDGTLVAGTVAVVTAPSHGTTSIDAVTGAITYTDNGTETTDDTFTYTVEDNLGGLSNEATVTISITHANGTCGMGLSLDGSDDWVNVPNLVFSGDFTVEAWVNLAPGISGVDALVGQEGTGIDFNFFGGKVRLFEPFTDRIAANTIIQPNTWTHIALTRLGSSLSLYINGLLDATGTWSGSFPIKALGRGNQSFAGHLEGELDEVRLWTVARSGSDITANYNQSVAANSAGLTAYWSFNESGQVVEDLSGSGNNGSLGSGAGAGNDDPQRVISGAPINENCNN